MKIVNLISEEKRTVIIPLSGDVLMFFGDTVEKFNIEEGDVVIARGNREIFTGIVQKDISPVDSKYDQLVLGDVEISYYFCNI